METGQQELLALAQKGRIHSQGSIFSITFSGLKQEGCPVWDFALIFNSTQPTLVDPGENQASEVPKYICAHNCLKGNP